MRLLALFAITKRAKDGAFEVVLTMSPDQGQVAMKLMGFDRGVTLLGRFEFPICTPAHDTAYDIAGMGNRGNRSDESVCPACC
ncbi:MAG: 4-hydroxythreonine-4-phosphate dehydrogenase PdxA [Burkholderiales bacterium]